jgi:hypothetical protein
MFIIPCKYTPISNGVEKLTQQIRQFHPNEKIMVVDSNSDTMHKGYLKRIRDSYGVLTEDIANKHYHIGAWWTGFKKYPDEDYYFFFHDSMYVKANLDYLKEKDLFILAHFNREVAPSFNAWNDRFRNETLMDKNHIKNQGKGVYGSIFGCKNWVIKKMLGLQIDKLLPSNKPETGPLEGGWGMIFESLGFDLVQCALFGDILELESPSGKSGVFPHNTSWQYPVEKYYNSLRDPIRSE